ncbi:hypothetical protein [Viridibacterium curvum]|uniref:DUF1851 domain-containing protein n=1 Tax=Viridibacterium curvum TaxID=1101404 RepID=A0ABP9QEH9_9RHOO
MQRLLVSESEYLSSTLDNWEGVIPLGFAFAGMTIFGDLLLRGESSVLLLRLSCFEIEEIGTVIEEAEWQLEAPEEREAHWVYPSLLGQLPTRTEGMIYHFVQPLGLGGVAEVSNVVLLPISQAHQGLRKLWNQVAQSQ